MGLAAQIGKDSILYEYFAEAEARGEARGESRGERQLLQLGLEAKFGPLPGWVLTRIEQAAKPDIEKWIAKSYSARSLDTLFGKKNSTR